MNTEPLQRLTYTETEAAAALGVTAPTIKRMIKRGEIARVIVGRRRFIPRDELERLLGTATTKPEAA
jgi:excisionase family DNA binding protein